MDTESKKQRIVSALAAGIRLKFITEITAENISSCRQMMAFGEMRHLDGVQGNFAVSDTQYIASSSLDKEKLVPPLIFSSERPVIEQAQFVFETLWSKAIPAGERIQELEGDSPSQRTSVHYGDDLLSKLKRILENVDFEIRIIIPHPDVAEYLDKSEVMQLLLSIKSTRNISIRILASFGDKNRITMLRISPYVQYKYVDSLPMKSITCILDKKEILLAAVIDSPSGLDLAKIIHSNDKLLVEKMLATFDALWTQVEDKEMMLDQKNHAELLLDLITHDIGNYNQIASSNLELAKIILDGKPGQRNASVTGTDFEELCRYVAGIARAFERSSSLVDNIRRLEKMHKESEVILASQDVMEAIDLAISTVRNEADRIKKQVVFSFNPPDGKVLVLADKLLEELFVNLFANAVRASGEDQARIEVDVRETFVGNIKYWMINVSDHGIGIPDEVKPELFARFYSKAKGSGLGLAIVRALVERYRGKIWVGDRIYNDHSKGAKFGILLRDAPAASKKG
jgi:signal transduction histidine kinase